MIQDFISIDFETANNRRWSVCQIGITQVKGGQVISSEAYLINPETQFHKFNIKIHNIHLGDVVNSPTFETFWYDTLNPLLSSAPLIVSHNADFDISVLHSCLNRYDIEIPKLDYLCTLEISKALLNMKHNKLSYLVEYFDLCTDAKYHDAGYDSYCCALLLLHYNQFFKNNILHYINYSIDISIDLQEYDTSPSNKLYEYQQLDTLSAIQQLLDLSQISDSPFLNKNIVITGDFSLCDRDTLYQIIINLGGVIKSSVSKKTDILLVGTPDLMFVKDKENGQSTKHIKAIEINQCATCETEMIHILNEKELLIIFKEMRCYNASDNETIL